MKAVIWTDVLQFSAVSIGIALIFAMAVTQIPGGAAEAFRIAGEAGRLKWLNLSTDPRELTSLWACVIGGMVLCMSPLTTDQAVLQRLFTTKSQADCRQSILVQSVLVIPITLLLSFAGIALFSFYRLHPNRLAGLPTTDAIVPFFAVQQLPHGAAGLVVACILSASMAVMSAGINALTTATTVDFYQRLIHPDATSSRLVSVGRWGTVGWGLLATLVALFADRLGELALAYNRVSSVISGPLLGIFLLATLTRRAVAAGALGGAVAGGAAVGIVCATTDWSFFWYGPIGCLTSVAVGWLISLFLPPPDKRKTWGLVVGYGEPGA
jgi:Na+/proline symporter